MADEPPDLFDLAVQQFNQGEFYACHDSLESLWAESSDPDRTFLQGVLQIAVACYHLGNNNLRGAIILLGEGTQRLRAYQPCFYGLAVTPLIHQSQELLADLQQHYQAGTVPLQQTLVLPKLSYAADAASG